MPSGYRNYPDLHTTYIEPFEKWHWVVDVRGSGDQFQCDLYFDPLDDHDGHPCGEKHGHSFNLRREHLEKVVRTLLSKLQTDTGALANVDTRIPPNDMVEKERDRLKVKAADLERKLKTAEENNRRLNLKSERYKLEFDWHNRPAEIPNRPSPASKALLQRMGICGYCGLPIGTDSSSGVIEHIWPRSKGGTNHDANLTLACLSCNTKKSDNIDPHTWHPVFTAETLRKQLGEWSVGDIAITNQMEEVTDDACIDGNG